MAIQKRFIFSLVLMASICATTYASEKPTIVLSARGEGTVEFYDVLGGIFLQMTASVPVGKHPGEMCLSPDGKQIFVSNGPEKNVAVIDIDKKTVIGNLSAPGMQSPDGCAVSPDSKELYSVDPHAEAVFVFAIESKQLVKKIPVGKEPRRAIFSPDGKRVLVSNANSDNLSVIDPKTYQVISTVKTGMEPRGLAYSPDGKLLAVALIQDDSVQLFKADTLEFKQQLAAVRSPVNLAFSPDSQRVYVVGHYNDEIGVIGITPLKSRLSNTIPVPYSPVGMLELWALTGTDDGKYLYTANIADSDISVIDTQLQKTVRVFPSGKQPIAMIYVKASGGTVGMSASARLQRYRSLAQQAMDAVKKNDLAAATKFCQTLEEEWDGGEQALRQKSPEVWSQIDEAMDDFIHPITRSGGVAPNPAALNAVYQNFLAKLKQAE